MAHSEQFIRPFDMIKDLTDKKHLWKIAVRIIDLWYVQELPKPGHLEMILMDSKGDKIQVAVRNDEFVAWSDKLIEHQTYVMHNFNLVRNNLRYKACEHPYRMYFTGGTTLKQKQFDDIPLFEYHFKNFSDILSGNFRTDLLVDLIGAVDKIVPSQTKAELKKAVFNMKDLSGDVVNCTLWEEHAMKFLSSYGKYADVGPVVIILTHARIKEPEGKYPATVSNSLFGSKLLINEDILEIQNFKRSFSANELSSPSSQQLSQVSEYSQFSEQERFMYNAQVKSISAINRLTTAKEVTCVTVGKTVMHIAGKQGWYYEACNSCTLGAKVENSPFTCQCLAYNEKSIPRYKLEIRVVHNKDNAKFIFWDRQCADIIGMSALELRNKMLEAGEDDPKAFPKPLDRMLTRTVALRVKVQPSYRNCSVIKLSENPELIKAILEQFGRDEDNLKGQKENPDISKTIEYDSDTFKMDKSKSDMNESLHFDTQSLSGTADHDPDVLAAVTPAKRLSSAVELDENVDEALVSAQLSSTKMTKQIKNE